MPGPDALANYVEPPPGIIVGDNPGISQSYPVQGRNRELSKLGKSAESCAQSTNIRCLERTYVQVFSSPVALPAVRIERVRLLFFRERGSHIFSILKGW